MSGIVDQVGAKSKTIAPSFRCRAWCNINGPAISGTSTAGIRDSGNVSSLTDHGTSVITMSFITPMPHINYAYTWAGTQDNSNYGYPGGNMPYAGVITVNGVKVITYGGSPQTDWLHQSMCVFC